VPTDFSNGAQKLGHPVPLSNLVVEEKRSRSQETMRRFNLSRDYTVRLLNEAIAGCEGQDIRNWARRMRSPGRLTNAQTRARSTPHTVEQSANPVHHEALAKPGLIDKLFERFGRHLEAAGYIARGGQIIDATIGGDAYCS
jgi:hypothetical protein